MLSGLSNLTKLINQDPDLKLLLSSIQKNDDDYWLVGGCLRNALLNLSQVDIDIACSGDPTALIQAWAAEVSGRWFWLDAKRKQSRVLLQHGLILDFAPLRAPTIIEDLQLRDFTINALALPLDELLPGPRLIDPLNGMNHLHKKQLQSCSTQSFIDDPLRMLKGIRHAVTLDFILSSGTLKQILSSAHLLADISGERIRDELGKILSVENSINGIELLIDSGLLGVLFGQAGSNWNRKVAARELNHLNNKICEIQLEAGGNLSDFGSSEPFSVQAVFLFAQLLKNYSPADLSGLLRDRLRLSRHHQKLLVELQIQPKSELFLLATSINGRRRQALLVEQLEPFAYEKLLYWGVCGNIISVKRMLQLWQSFSAEQKLGRVPDLLNGGSIAAVLNGLPDTYIGKWKQKLKLAEINDEISTCLQAENWLKSKLSFDNKEA